MPHNTPGFYLSPVGTANCGALSLLAVCRRCLLPVAQDGQYQFPGTQAGNDIPLFYFSVSIPHATKSLSSRILLSISNRISILHSDLRIVQPLEFLVSPPLVNSGFLTRSTPFSTKTYYCFPKIPWISFRIILSCAYPFLLRRKPMKTGRPKVPVTQPSLGVGAWGEPLEGTMDLLKI